MGENNRREFLKQAGIASIVAPIAGQKAASTAAASETSFIDLYVEDEEGNPVEGATVVFESADWTSSERTTDENGFTWYEVENGDWQVHISKDGFEDKTVEVDVQDDVTLDVTLEMPYGPGTSFIDLYVEDHEGNPVEGATVVYDSEEWTSNERTTDEDGFNWYEVKDGVWQVHISKDGFEDKTVEVDVQDDVTLDVELT